MLPGNWFAIPGAPVICVEGIIAIIGNAAVICLVLKSKRLHKLPNYLLVGQSTTDLLYGIWVGLFTPILYNATTPDPIATGTAACGFLGIGYHITCFASISSLSFISYERYHKICLKKAMPTRRALKGYCFAVGVTCLFSLLGFIPPKEVFGYYGRQVSGIACWNVPSLDVYQSFCVLLVSGSVGFMLICYIKIYQKYKKVVEAAQSKYSKERLKRAQREEFKLARQFAAIIIMFIVNWTPYLLSSLWGMGGGHVRPWMPTSGVAFAVLNSALNPILYGVMNRNLRREAKIVFCRGSTVYPELGVTDTGRSTRVQSVRLVCAPATDTPATDTPATDTPATDTPATDTPTPAS